MFGYERENATGRIPVFSASGVRLASCNPLKAARLLRSGKAEAFLGAGETFYLRLKFVPKSPIILPEGEGQMVHLKEDLDVFKLIPPRKVYIKELVEVAKSNHRCLISVKPEDWNYLEALLYGRWFELEDPGILARLAPILKAILKGLAENSEVKVEASEAQRMLRGNLEDDAFYVRSRGVQPSEGGCLNVKENVQTFHETCEAQEMQDILSADCLFRAREFGGRREHITGLLVALERGARLGLS